MGFGNFLRGIVAQVNPFDNGKTYGSYNPPKKKEDQFGNPLPSAAPAPSQAPSSTPMQVQAQRPENLFAGLQGNLQNPGQHPNNGVTVNPNVNLSPLLKPSPGTVITPNQPPGAAPSGVPAQPKPGWTAPAIGSHAVVAGTPGTYTKNGFVPDNQPKPTGFWGHVGNAFKTAGETAVGTVANIPEVGLAAGRAATGIVQGVTQIPHIVTAATATGTQKLNEALPSGFTHALNTGAQTANTGVKTATTTVNKPIDALNRGIDRAATGYANAVPVAAGGLNVYKKEQIPLNILAGLATLGGSTAAEGAGQAGRAEEAGNFLTRLLNKPLTSNTDNIVSRTGQAVGNRAAPVVQTLSSPISSTRSGIGRLVNGRTLPTAERIGVDAGEAGIVAENAGNAAQTTQIPVVQEGGNVPIPVRTPQPGDLIRETSGDARFPGHVPTPEEAVAARARNAFDNQAPGAPDQGVSGVVNVPRPQPFKVAPEAAATAQNGVIDQYAKFLKDMGEGNGTQLVPDGEGGYYRTSNNFRPGDTGGKRMTKADWRDQAEADLKAGKAEPGHQQAFNDATNPDLQSLIAGGDQTAEAPIGRPIAVKEVTGIPVRDETNVPTGTVVTPGEVRATQATAPSMTKSEAVANTPVSTAPVQLPAETQAILDNPKQFNSRQVAAARNQRKLARQMAKTKEDTAAAVDRIETASPAATSPEGHVATGQFDTSANGGAYQTASRSAEKAQAATETAQMSPGDAIKTARDNQAQNGGFNRRDVRNIQAMFDAKRIARGTPEFNEAKQILKEDGTIQAQSLALRGGNTIRRTASPTELINQYESKIYRLAEDPSKIDSNLFDQVDAATTRFTDARDAATQAYNRFTESPTTQNAKVYHAAQDAAEKADKEAKITEFNVANKVLKGNKDTSQVRELQKMAQSADLYQMDGIDASMLSGTGTFARNFVNAGVGGTEEGLFGGLASRAAKLITGEDIGGGAGRGTLSGFRKGVSNIVDASKARASNAGWNPLEHVKNWATTGNQLGDSIIDSQTTHNVLDHYTQMLKGQGYTGRELTDRAGVMARQDPEEVGRTYAGYARAAAGLGSGITRSSKIETVIKNGLSDMLSGGNPNTVSEAASKLITRMTVGFPTAVGRTIVEGGKRATLGAPTALRLFSSAARNDPAVQAQIIKQSIQQFGSGATTGAIFYGLGQRGIVTGSYPTDPAERAKWQREGITENSIKIGDNYYQLPSYLGSAALPALFAATLGRNNGDVAQAAGEVAKGLPQILPTDQASNVLDFINGKTNAGKFLTQTAASATRALEPGGALLNQIAKSFDSTTNDTNSGTALQNFAAKVLTGIPGAANTLPSKTDDAGNVLHNPGALPLAFGASTTTQNKGVEQTKQIDDTTNTTLKGITDAGGLNDPNIKNVINTDDNAKKILVKLQAGKQVSPADLKKLQSAITKGVPNDGSDTAYLEKGQYGTHLTALNIKRQELAADPTTKPSELAKLDLNIKRGQVYKDNKIPYTDITDYKTTSLSDWRAMGDDTSDKYDPAAYQKLWNMDQLMTKAGASDNTKDPTASKFSAKQPGKGRRGSGVAGGYSAGFGTLKAGVGAPNVKNYATIGQQSGSVPVIPVNRPNIVHKVGSSG